MKIKECVKEKNYFVMNPNALSVLTLNLRFGLAEDGVNRWAFRKHGFSELFSQYPAAFITFQEANDFQIDFLKERLPDHEVIGQRRPAPGFWQNNVIFYHNSWTCIYSSHFFLSATPDIPSRFRQSRWPRQCTMGMFSRGKRTLICITTHFDFEAIVQIEGAELILDRLSNLPRHHPVILTGDFNATPDSTCHQIFTGQDRKPKVDAPQLKNVFKSPFPGTFHGFRGEETGDHIDWILYCGGILPKHAEVIRQPFAGMYPSDHFPVVAVFEWQNGQTRKK